VARAFFCSRGALAWVSRREPRWVVLAVTVIVAAIPLGAIAASLTTQDIERALKLGRGTEAQRARFHARYVVPLPDSVAQYIEVVTEFRRYVLKTEERARVGDWMFAQGTRAAQEVLRPWRGRVSIIARLQFDPLNTYPSVPPFVLLVGGSPQIEPIEGHITPLRSLPSQARTRGNGAFTYLVGATVQLDFDAASLGQTERPVSLILDGRELGRVTIDFAAIE